MNDNKKIDYNGWIIFWLIIGILFSENNQHIYTALMVLYVGWVQYLRVIKTRKE